MSVCLSVRLSARLWHCAETIVHIVKRFIHLVGSSFFFEPNGAKNSDNNTSTIGVKYRWVCKNMHISTNVADYLGNGTNKIDSYYGP